MFRFRLITLFLVMSLAAIGAAVYGVQRRAALAEERALAKIGSKGGWVLVYSDGVYVHFVDPNAPRLGLCGTGLERTYGPTGSPLDFSDADLALLADVRKIRSLNLQGTAVTVSAIQSLKQKLPDCHIEG